MTLKGIIFDLDGVLVDTVPAHFAAWLRVFTEEGYAFDDAVYQEKVDGKRREDGVASVMVGADRSRQLAVAERKDRYFIEQIEQDKFRVFEGSLRFLTSCHQAGIKLATASSSKNVRYILARAKLQEFFSAIVGGDEVSKGKPDPAIFLTAADRLGLDTQSCIVVEDAVSGVEAAKAAHFYCIGVERGVPSSRLSRADMVVPDLGDVDLARLRNAFSGA